jgi:two-component system sensor histidine kinase KdpD
LLSSADAALGILVLEWAEGNEHEVQEEDLGALVNLVSIATERCLLLERLAEADLVRKSEEFKTALLSSVSHDMRTPLSAISASASSLAQYGGDLDEAAKADMLGTIQEQCARLNRYTTNLLNLGRLQAGLDRNHFTPCDALEALGSAIAMVRGLGSGHMIVKNIAPSQALVKADPVMLEQVFYNVLENSVRYSGPESPITVSAVMRRSRILVSIRDVGPGIPPGEFSRIFERFYRAGQSSAGEGSGLGLAIARGFTEAFGGRIWAGVPDDPAGGTIVTIELPLAGAGEGS